MRLFIAISFNEETKEQLMSHRNALKAASESGSFTSRENLHLTLAFLGECKAEQASLAVAAIDEIKLEPFGLSIERIGRFKRSDGDIWWAGIQENTPLSRLQRSLTDKLTTAGFDLDTRNFSPHITLGRCVVTDMIPKSIPAFGQTVRGIELMKSERVNGKLTYTAIHTVKSIGLTNNQMWKAAENRDGTYDGKFFLAVKTTGIYCYPSCKARTPLRKNVLYFATGKEARDAGFRPCKRCRPE